jgi:hypothetical protein
MLLTFFLFLLEVMVCSNTTIEWTIEIDLVRLSRSPSLSYSHSHELVRKWVDGSDHSSGVMSLAMWLVVMIRLASSYVLRDLVVVKMGVRVRIGIFSFCKPQL